MRAGDLRHHIIIELKTTGTQDGYGTPTNAWTSNVGVWASIMPFGGREYFNAKQIKASETHRVIMRYQTLAASTEIGPGYCRIKFGARRFNINNVRNVDERSIDLEMLCSEAK